MDFTLTEQLLINFLHSSDTGQEMGVKWDSTPMVYRIQESL